MSSSGLDSPQPAHPEIAALPSGAGDRAARLAGLRVAFAGGGTGGHIYPALGIDDALRIAAAGGPYERCFFGNRDGLEARLVTSMPLAFVPSAPLARNFSPRTLRTFARNIAGVVAALRALRAYRPALVIATGGYVCFPVVAAARLLCALRLLRCRIALLEINAHPGLTNRILAPLVDEVWISYAGSRRFFGRKAMLTGAPVRASLLERAGTAHARRSLGLRAERTTIVVMGGSQGAASINATVAQLVTTVALPPDWQILHVCGERDFPILTARMKAIVAGNVVRLVPYLDDPSNAYAAADIVVARAGASTLAELAVTSTPAVLVPYPFASDDHQAVNARAFAAGGAAVVVRDADLTPATLEATLARCLDAETIARMRAAAGMLSPAGAATKIVDRIVALAGSRSAESAASNDEIAHG